MTYLKGSPRSRAPRRRWTRAGCRPAPSRSAPRPSPPRGSACPSWGWRSLPRAPPGCSGWPPPRPASALPATPRAGCRWSEQGTKEMFYLTTHSTHFIFGYMASDIWLRTILIARKETCWRHMGYCFRLTARVSFICTIPQTGQHIPQPLLHQSWSTGWNEKYYLQNDFKAQIFCIIVFDTCKRNFLIYTHTQIYKFTNFFN